MDVASIILMWLLKTMELSLILLISGAGLHPGALLWAIPELIALLINIFLFAVFIQVIISWVNPGAYNPAITMLSTLTEPLMRPARRLIPPIGGTVDISPVVALIILEVVRRILVSVLAGL